MRKIFGNCPSCTVAKLCTSQKQDWFLFQVKAHLLAVKFKISLWLMVIVTAAFNANFVFIWFVDAGNFFV